MEKVASLWGQPMEKVTAGVTSNNYPVELWVYHRNGTLLRKGEECTLIFVDKELYLWAFNDPDRVFKTLLQLGVFQEEASNFGLLQYQQSLRDSVEQSEQNRKTLETIRSYENFKNTQMQIQTMQQMQTIRQQQLRPPPQPFQPGQRQ